MDAPPNRLLEELAVGVYVPVAVLGGIVVLAAFQIDAPFVGAFVAFWLVGLCLLAAVAVALVVLGVNARRAVAGDGYERRAVVLAATIPASPGVGVAVLFAGLSIRVTEAVLLGAVAVALVVAPAGLVVAVFGDHLRSRRRSDA
jgi:hypothetical protein